MNNQHNPIQTNQIKINFLFTGFSAIFVVTVPDKPLFFHQEIFFFLLLCICGRAHTIDKNTKQVFLFRRIFACFIQCIQNVNEEWSIIMFFLLEVAIAMSVNRWKRLFLCTAFFSRTSYTNGLGRQQQQPFAQQWTNGHACIP